MNPPDRDPSDPLSPGPAPSDPSAQPAPSQPYPGQYPPPPGQYAPPPGQYPPPYPGQPPPAAGPYAGQPPPNWGQYHPQYGPPSRQPFKLSPWVVVLFAALFGLLFAAAVTLFQRSRGHTAISVGATQPIAPGVLWHEVDLPGGDGTRTLWIYEPQHPAAAKLPCVFIAPAGSTCFCGMELGDGDRPEHLPYVREGWIVVAYSLDGNIGDRADNSRVFDSIETFRAAHSGLDDEKAAVDYALGALPAIDRQRMFAVGHSSAATMALLAAANDHRLAGCVAYAPLCDVKGQAANRGVEIDTISRHVPDFDLFLADCSPINSVSGIRCPVYLFHADDDSNIPTEDVARFADTLSRTNSQVTFARVPTGDHYDSMIQQGIPRGIAWIEQH